MCGKKTMVGAGKVQGMFFITMPLSKFRHLQARYSPVSKLLHLSSMQLYR